MPYQGGSYSVPDDFPIPNEGNVNNAVGIILKLDADDTGVISGRTNRIHVDVIERQGRTIGQSENGGSRKVGEEKAGTAVVRVHDIPYQLV